MAVETQRITTYLGRSRFFENIKSTTSYHLRKIAERAAINTLIQGTAADLIKVALINVDKAISKTKIKIPILLTVHDEIIFEIPYKNVNEAKSLIVKEMESVWQLSVPLKVNVSHGVNWAKAH